MAKLIALFVVGTGSLAIGVVVILQRKMLAALNKRAIEKSFPDPLATRPAGASTPRLFVLIGIAAIVLGVVTLTVATLALVGIGGLK